MQAAGRGGAKGVQGRALTELELVVADVRVDGLSALRGADGLLPNAVGGGVLAQHEGHAEVTPVEQLVAAVHAAVRAVPNARGRVNLRCATRVTLRVLFWICFTLFSSSNARAQCQTALFRCYALGHAIHVAWHAYDDHATCPEDMPAERGFPEDTRGIPGCAFLIFSFFFFCFSILLYLTRCDAGTRLNGVEELFLPYEGVDPRECRSDVALA